MTTLTESPMAPLLEDLFAQAEAPASPRTRAVLAGVSPDRRAALMSSPTGYRELYTLMKDAYLAVSRPTAALLYMLVRATGARAVVEFGTSLGVSTLHLAAAVRDNGSGRVITTEFEPSKVERAQATFHAAGVADLIELRAGDALQTLAHDLPESIDLVLLDGAKPLYAPVLGLLEPRLRAGAVIVADDAGRSPEYLERVRSADGGFMSQPFGDDVELSVRVG